VTVQPNILYIRISLTALKILPNASKMARARQQVVCEKWMRTSTRPSLGGCARLSPTWGLGCPVGVGWVDPGLGVGPAGLVRALGKYLDPAGDRDWCGPQNPAYGGTKISGERPRGLSAQGVTSDLATCGPLQGVLAQGIFLDKIYHWGSVVGS